MADFNSKYTGEQVEAFLDEVATLETPNTYHWKTYDGGNEGTVDTETYLSIVNADVLVIDLGINGSLVSHNKSNILYGTNGTRFSFLTGDSFIAEFVIYTNGSYIVRNIEIANKEELSGKQDTISDLDAIRSGAEKGTTALQSVPSEYVTETELNNKGYATTSALNNKVDKVNGKQLSTEDFTTILKTKLEGLNNYDDTELSNALSALRGDFDRLVSGDTTTAIKSFNDIIAFLDGIQDTQDLSSIIASIQQQIAGKQDTISDLATIRSGAAKGATALQSYTEKYTGTITGITMNGASKGTSGVVNLGTVITAHQDISGKADKSSLATVATSGSYNDLSNKPTIPSAVTESTVSGWGFTKNTGTYSKPSTGIPKTDLASAVQTSLGKADTALQSYTEQYKGTVTGVKVNGSTKSPSSGTVDIGNVVTSIKINGSTKTPSNGVVDLGTISGGSSSGGSGAYAEINHGTSDTTFGLTPNTFHVWDEVESLTLTVGSEQSGVANEYIFQFTSGATPTTLTLPDGIKWANDTPPTIKSNYIYQFSILKGLASVLEFKYEVSIYPITLTIGDNGNTGVDFYNYCIAKLEEAGGVYYSEIPTEGQLTVNGEQCTQITVSSMDIQYLQRVCLLTASHPEPSMDCYYINSNGVLSLYED